MVRAAHIAVTVALGFPLVVSAQPNWTAALEDKGWGRVVESPGAVLFLIRDAPGHEHRMWARYEYQSPQTQRSVAYQSAVDLDDVDCADRRLVTRQIMLYPENNLGGAPTEFHPDPTWEYGVPSSFGAMIIDVACSVPLRPTTRAK